MQDLTNYKRGIKAYRIGFSLGLLIGTGTCFFLGKVVWIFPVFFALAGGAIGFNFKMRKDGQAIK